ncbi:MAG TPA: SDR family oxidoreductase [Clostridiales bacterium]|jgi:short-subunit dehydrogenase|nr:SDR family oxidoreductase [Clostridiales bacterium]
MRKTALITGASGGIGYEFAYLFARDGYNLVLIARSQDKLNKLKQDLQNQFDIEIINITKDLSLPNSAQEVFDEIQRANINIDVLVNNAGLGDFGEFEKSDIFKIDAMIELNINTLTKLTRLFLPKMLLQKSGKILNVSSLGGFQPGPLMAVYYASKAYVLSFSEAISRELKGTGVSVTALCPGPTKTNFAQSANLGMSGLFVNLQIADAKKVAEFGYKKMEKGKVIAVPGFYNKIATIGVKLLPRKFIRNMVYRIQKERDK